MMQSTDLRVEFKDEGGAELRWCVFTKNSRGSVAKIICQLDRQSRTTAHVVSVYVHPRFRGRGLGEELVGLAKTFLQANGFQYLTLSAEENTTYKFGRLVELYRRCGFEIHPPGLTEFPIEYNGDEVFRKVPMRCSLMPASTATTTTVASPRLYDNVDFCIQMRQECLTRLQHGMGVIPALEWVELHYASSQRFALALAQRIRSKGHPDWMELAGYLIHLGEIQFKHKEWHAPFILPVRPPSSTSASSGESGDGEEEELVAKCGPLPEEEDGDEESPCRVLDTERYVGQGLDETTLSWSSWEYLFTVLTHQLANNSSSAPIELAQVLRYFRLTDWLQTCELDHLQSGMDEELKQMALAFRECVLETKRATSDCRLLPSDIDLSRRQELISKYLGEDVYV
ncbi:hypothetical protein BASA81_008048 [Batrachochytrium salamandrivorans]|nr:hypothetical protein BASA81_008048 [Batrachochytrium salamandrivorans]